MWEELGIEWMKIMRKSKRRRRDEMSKMVEWRRKVRKEIKSGEWS